MHTELSKWGNSLGVRIPSHIAKALELGVGSAAHLDIEDGKIIITPAIKPSLKTLLASIEKTDAKEEELFADDEVGNEVSEW